MAAAATTRCRAAAVNTVLPIDAQFKTMLDVLCQTPFGRQRGLGCPADPPEAHCIHTVRAHRTLLLTAVRAAGGFDEQLTS